MKNLKFLISICIILLGFTLNSQTNRNIGMSETADALAITAKGTDLLNSIFIGHKHSSIWFCFSNWKHCFRSRCLDAIVHKNVAIGFNAGTAMGGADGTTGQSNVFVEKMLEVQLERVVIMFL